MTDDVRGEHSMSGRPGSGRSGEGPGQPRDEGLSIFGPLELPRDETEYLPAYDEYAADYGPGGIAADGATRIATPSMLVPPDPGYPAGHPPGYPGSPPPG
jgi:hypothetical protein